GDTHIFGVGNRTGIAPGKTPHAVELGLEKVTPPQYKLNAHHWLILHGRHVCKARKPDCPNCVVAALCRYKAKTGPDELIAARAAAAKKAGATPPPGVSARGRGTGSAMRPIRRRRKSGTPRAPSAP